MTKEVHDLVVIIYELSPIFLIGIMVGAAGYFSRKNDEDRFIKFIENASSAGILAITAYLILSEFEISQKTQLGISIFVAFAGYDKLVDLLDRVLSKK